MSAPLDLTFVTSGGEVEQLPHSRREVALAGRSNVGKSSLINALARRKGLAKVSGKPGRTQTLNLFSHAGGGTVVDLPGYGYAASAGKKTRAAWARRMERYLTEREHLVTTLLLIDGEVGPTALDRDMLAWLRANDVPFRVVATKHDKVGSSKRVRRRRDLAAGCGVPESEVLWVSAERNVGIDRLRDVIRELLAG